MKTLLVLFASALLAGETLVFAQQTAGEAPSANVTASTPAPAQPSATPAPATPPASPAPATPPAPKGDAERWREEVLAWEAPHRIEKGTTAGSLKEINRSVLILGTVDGDVSTVSGDIAVLGEVNGNVSAISGAVTVLGKVNGDVSVVSGDLRVAGEVTGKKTAVEGKVITAQPGKVDKPVTSNDKKTQFNFKINGGHFDFNFDGTSSSPGGVILNIKDFWFSPFMLVWRSGLLILWVAVGCAVAALFQPSIVRAQPELSSAPARCAALGFLWTMLFWILLAGSLILSLMIIGIPLLIILVAFDLALKVFGMTLVFRAVGEWIATRLNRPGLSIYAAVFIGACALGLLRLVPVLGSLIWFVASLFGIGAALTSRFGSPHRVPPVLPSAPAAVSA